MSLSNQELGKSMVVLCRSCKLHIFQDELNAHKSTIEHLENAEKIRKEKENENISCKVCPEGLLRENLKDHQTTLEHIAVQREAFGEEECLICNEKYVRGYVNLHNQTDKHLSKVMENKEEFNIYSLKSETKAAMEDTKTSRKSSVDLENADKIREDEEDDEIICKVCQKLILRKKLKDHKNTVEHIAAQKEIHGEEECQICNEKYVKGYWRQHKQTIKHKAKVEENKEVRKIDRKKHEAKAGKEIYVVQQRPTENQQYLDTLAAFYAIRHSLYEKTNFGLSISNKKWRFFGDIVFEIHEPNEIVAIQCKKVETRKNYKTNVLKAEHGHLSLKNQYEHFQKLRNCRTDSSVSFKLVTVAGITIDESTLIYSDLNDWHKKEAKEDWFGKEIEIKPARNKRKDYFNTTNDTEDVCCFKIRKGGSKTLGKELNKFRLYYNQKNPIELKLAIKNVIDEYFSPSFDITDHLIQYIRKFFKTDRVLKHDESNFKMSRDDFLLKVAEFLLSPFCVFPERVLQEKKIDLWNTVLQNFDIVIMKSSKDSMEKIYRILNQILKEQTQFFIDNFNKTIIDLENMQNLKLKSNLYNHEGSLECLYLALWKSELIPLVLKVSNKTDFEFILKIINFYKSRNFDLKFIITTDTEPSLVSFPEHLRVFRNFANLKYGNESIWKEILNKNVALLNEEITLKQIIDYNEDLLQKFTPDVLLNILFEDFSFKDFSVPITREIYENAIVLEDNLINYICQCKNDETEENFKYLLNVNGVLDYIEVPPEL